MKTSLEFLIPFLIFSLVFGGAVAYYKVVDSIGRKAIKRLPNGQLKCFKNCKIWFKGHVAFGKSNFFWVDPFKPLYTYSVADIYVFDDKMVVCGKSRMIGFSLQLPPFAICLPNCKIESGIPNYRTEFKASTVVGKDFEIVFEDRDYKKNISLIVRGIGNEIHDLLSTTFTNQLT